MADLEKELDRLIAYNDILISKSEVLEKQVNSIPVKNRNHQKLMERLMTLQETIIQNEIEIYQKQLKLLKARHEYERTVEASKIKHYREMELLERERRNFMPTTMEKEEAIKNSRAIPSTYSVATIKCRTPCQLYRRKSGSTFESNSLIEDEKRITCYRL